MYRRSIKLEIGICRRLHYRYVLAVPIVRQISVSLALCDSLIIIIFCYRVLKEKKSSIFRFVRTSGFFVLIVVV